MNNIDKRLVEMQFDNRQFEQGVQTSIKSLDSLKKGLDLDGSAKSLSELEKAGSHFSLSGIGSAVDTIAGRFSTLGIIGVTALQNIANSAINTGKQMLESLTIAPISQGFDEYELKMGSVQTIMASTGADLQTVSRYLEELNVYADKTIYSFSDMTASIGKFTNAGVDLDSAVKAIQGISNVAAVSGANSNEASRAMYNFSQALSAGYVKLIDWKSIENANMATVEFKQQLLDSAVAVGTLTKTSDGMYKTLKGNTLSATKNFNDTLQDQWMTSKVLIRTLGNYADETTEIGKKAFAAAQDVKTFSQLMDTLKEAVGSGWSATFENIFGNFEEAKELWTGVSTVIGGMIDKSSEARNSVLADWKEMGGRDAIIEGLAAAFDGLYGIVLAVKEALEEIFPPVTAEQLVNFSNKVKEAGENLKTFFHYATGHQYKRGEKIVDTSATINELEKLDKVLKRGSSGDSVRVMQEYLKQLGYDVGEIDGIFGPKTEAALKAFQEEHSLITDGILGKNTIQSLGEALGLGETKSEFEVVDEEVTTLGSTLSQLKAIAKGVFSTFQIGVTVFKFLFGVGTRIGKVFTPVVSMILKIAEAAGRFMTALNEKISGSTKFTEWLEKLDELLVPVKEYIEQACQALLDFLGIGGDLSKVDFGKVIDDLIAKFKEFFGITEEGSISLDGIDFDPASFIQKVKDGITSAIKSLREWITSFTKKSGDETAKDVESSGGFDAMTLLGVGLAVAIGAIGTSIYRTISQFAKIGKNINKVLSSITKSINEHLGEKKSSNFETIANGVKSFAIAIGILAASVYVLSKLKLSELGTGLTAVVILVGVVIGAIAAFKKVAEDFDDVEKVGKFLIMFAAAIGILSLAMRSISEMSLGELIQGFVGLVAIMAAVGIFMTAISKVKIDTSVILALLPMAIALDLLIAGFIVLTLAMKMFSIADIIKAIVGIGVIVIAMVALMKTISKAKPNIGAVLALIPMAVALDLLIAGFIVLALAMKVITIEDMIKSVVSIGVLVIAVAALMKTLSKAKPNIGAILGLIPVAVALDALILGFIVLTLTMKAASIGDVVKALVSLGVIMIALSLFMKSLSKAKPSVGAILGILPVVAALDLMFAGFIALLYAVKGATFGDIVKAVVAMGAVMIAISLFMKTLGKLSIKSAISSLIGCVGIVAVMIAFSYSLSKIKNVSSKKILSFAGGLSALLIAMGALFALSGVGGLAGVGTALVGIVGVVGVISAIIAAFAGLSKIPGFQDFMNSGAESIGEIIGSFIGSMQGAIEASKVKSLSEGLSDLKDVEIDDDALDNVLGAAQKISDFSNGLPAKSNLTKVTDFFFGSELEQFARSMSTFGVCARSLMTSLSGIEWDPAVLVAPLAMAMALNTFEESLPEKTNAQKVIDYFFGSKLEQFARGMATFGVYSKTLAETMADVEFDKTMLDGPLAVAESLSDFESKLPENTAADSIINFFFGSKLEQFAKGMVTFAEKSKAISDTMTDVEFDKTMLDAPIAMAESLKQFTEGLPENTTSESIINFFFGSELEQFARGMETFATKSASIADTMKDVEFDATMMDAPIEFAKSLAKFSSDLPENTAAESIINFFFGDKLTQFANGMLTFAQKTRGVATAMDGVEFDSTMLDAPIAMAKALNSFSTDELPDKTAAESVIDFFFGDDLTQFSTGMEKFAQAAASVSTSMKGVEFDQTAIDAAITVGKGLVDMQAQMPEKTVGEKIADFLLGSDLDSLIEEMPKLGEMAASLANTASSITNLDTVKTDTDKIIEICKSVAGLMTYLNGDQVNFNSPYIDGYNTAFTLMLSYIGSMSTTLVDFEKNIKDIDFYKVGSLITPMAGIATALADLSALGDQGNVGITTLDTSVQKIPGILSILNTQTVDGEKIKEISTAIKDICAALNSESFVNLDGDSVTNFQTIMENLQSIFSSEEITFDSTAFTNGGVGLGEAIATGIASVDLSTSVITICDSALTTAGNYSGSFYTVGVNISIGMAKGISESSYIVSYAASRVASSALAAARRAIDSHSPSRAFMELGKDSDEGFAIGLEKYSRIVDASAGEMANSMFDTAKGSLANLSALIAENIDADPVIRPVIDLSNVQSGIQEMNDLISSGLSSPAMTSTENAAMISQGIRNMKTRQNGTNFMNGMASQDQIRQMGFDSESILGINKSRMNGGESTKEVVSEIKTLSDRIDALGEAVTHMKIVLDSGVLVGEMSSKMDDKLGTLAMRRSRGN